MNSPALDPAFARLPLAHRGLHGGGRIENSRAAFAAAMAAGYGIECDVQVSSDGQAMVFHDPDLDRLTDATGAVGAHDAAALGAIRLKGSTDGIPTLAQLLEMHARHPHLPLLIEMKTDGSAPEAVAQATARALAHHQCVVAVMSFDPRAVAHIARLAPNLARGLTSCDFAMAEDWPDLSVATRARLAELRDFEELGCAFLSHDWRDLNRARIRALKAQGAAVLCWTIRSPAQEAQARAVADNITFEAYRAALPDA